MPGFGLVASFESRNFVWKSSKLALVILSGCEDTPLAIVKSKYAKYASIILEVRNKHKQWNTLNSHDREVHEAGPLVAGFPG